MGGLTKEKLTEELHKLQTKHNRLKNQLEELTIENLDHKRSRKIARVSIIVVGISIVLIGTLYDTLASSMLLQHAEGFGMGQVGMVAFGILTILFGRTR